MIAVLTLLSGDAVNGGDGLSSSAIERDLGGDHTESDPCGGEETQSTAAGWTW